jgi:hypothetical protein
MAYQQNILYYRCASTNFEELHSVTVPATVKPAVIAANYAGNANYRLTKLTTLSGKVLRHFEKPPRTSARSRQEGVPAPPQKKERGYER